MNMFKDSGAKTPAEYIASLEEPRRNEIQKLHELIELSTGLKASMRSGMLGYGQYHYKYANGQEGEWFIIGLSSRKQYISLYVVAACEGIYVAETYKLKLPKAKIGKSCITFKNLADVDLGVIKELVLEGVATMQTETTVK